MAKPQQGNRNLEKFHGRLEKYGIKNVPDYETFSNVMQDASKRRKLYDRLVNKGHTMPSFESFSKTLGFEDAPQSEKTSGSYTPYTTQVAQKMVDVNQGSGDSNVFAKGNAPLAPEYHQQMQNVQPVNNAQTQNAQQPQQTAAAPDSTVVAPTTTSQDTVQVDNTVPDSTVVTPAISQDTIQTNGVMPDSTMVAPATAPQDTIQANNTAPTEKLVQNTDYVTQKPMDYMQLMAQKTAPIRDVMQQTQHAQQIAENEMEQQQLRREDYDNNSKLLEQEAAKYESALSEYEKAAEEFSARYPEGWQPKTKAEYDNYKNDLEVIKTQGNLIEAKRKVLEGEVNRLNELGDAINSYEMERLNSPAIQAQTLKGNINDLINSVRTELEEVDNKRNWVSRRGMQPKGGIMSLASSMNESVSSAGKPDEEVNNRTRLEISNNILSRTQRIIRASEAERKDEEVTAIWGKKASWLGTVAGNVADYMKGYWRGSVDKIMDGSVFDFGLRDLAETQMLYDAIKKNDAIEAIAKKKAEGKALSAEEKKVFAQGLSTSERALLDAAAMEVAATAMFKTGMGYTGGQIAVEMIPFALEIAINPAAAIGTTAGSGVLRYAMKKFGKTALKQSRKTLKTAITLTRLGTDLAVGGPTMALTTGAGKTFADFNRRRTGQIEYGLDDSGNLVFAGHEEGMNTGKAAATAIASQSLEYSTENMSEWGKAIKALGVTAKGSGKIADKIGRMFAYMDKTKVGRLIQDYRKYGHIGNPFEEYGEEVVNNIGNGIIDYLADGENRFTTDEGGVFNLHDNIETFLSVTVPQVIQSVIGLAAYGTSHRSINKGKYNERHAETIKQNIGIFGPDQWQALRGVLDEAEGIEDLARVTMSLVEDPDYTPEQRAAIIKYSQSLVAKRTEDMAETKMTDHVFETDPDYVELGNRTDPENGTITTATTTDGEVVYVKSADDATGTSVVYNPSTGETEQIPNNRIGSTEQPIDANEEAEKIAKARELATNMEVGSQLNIGGHVFEIVDFSPDTHMPIADIYGTEADVTTREMTYDEVLAANQQQEEMAGMTAIDKLRMALETDDQQLYNQVVQELRDSILLSDSLKDLENIEAELKKVVPDLDGFKGMIDTHRTVIMRIRLSEINSASTKEELAQIEQSIGDDDTINNDFKKAIAKRYAELENEAEQKSKKALDDVKALIDSTVDPAALDSIVLDGALSDNDRQVAQNLIEKKRRELAENAEKETPAADAVKPSTEAASAETAQQQPESAETAVSGTEEPAKETATEETPTQASQQTDGKESLVNKAGKKILDKWASAKKIVGNRVTNTFNKRKLKGYYVLVEAESLSPSHNPLDGFKKTEGFPEDKNGNTVNDRDYENDRNEQTGVVSLSTNYTGEALTNMPVIAKDSGIPYSGNKRTMAGQLAAINGTDSDYIESLKENLSVYGFDEEDLAQFTHPRVVFMLDESLPYDAETFALFNKRSEYAQGAVATMVKLGKIINQETFNRLMDSISGYETIGEVWADKNVVAQIISILQNSGLISEADFVLYVDNGELTESGKDLISGALVGKVLEGREDAVKALNDPDTKSLATSIITALPQIAINQRLGENSILTYIADAIILAHDARKSGVSGNMPITTHLRQTEMQFEEEQVEPVHPAVIAIGTFIHSNKTSYLRDFLKKYNKHYLENDENSISLFEDIPYEERLVGMLINAINELSKDIENDKKQTSYTRSMLQSLKSVNASLQNKLNQLKNGTGKQQQQSRDNRESGGRVESSARDGSEQVAANGSNGSVNDNGGVRGREEENGGRGAERIGAETADRGKEESNREEQQGTDDTTATETASPTASTTEEGGNPSGKTTSSSEGKKKRQSLPKNATRDEAKAYFDSVYGKDSERAKRKLEIWELSNDAYKLRAVYDPEKEAERQIKLMKLCVEDGLDFIKEGFVKFADWAKAMVTDFGEKIKKYLKQTYMSMTAYVDDRTFEQMDSAQTVRGFDLDSIVIDEEAEENNNNNNDDNGREEVLRGSRVSNGTDTNRPSRNTDNGGRGVQHGADHGGNGEVEMAGGRDRHIPQKHDNANGSDRNGRKGTDRDRQSDTGGRNADIEGTGSRDDVGRGTDILNGTESPETTDKTDRKEKERTKADLGDKTVPYAPHNKGNANDTVIPAGMANAVYRALDEVAAVHGNDIGAFVAKELGYKDTEELYRHLNGEQIDGVALAIHQLMQGKGFVLGDMGGIGKGRQGAAIIRWAISKGHKPIYFTKGANNFSGVLRDLYDIGSGNLKPFIINKIKKGEVTYGKSPEDTNVRYASNPTEDEYEQFYKTGTIPEGYDFILLTYSQLNHGDPQSVFETAKDYRSVMEKDKNGKPIVYDDRPVLVSPEADPYFRKANAIRLFAMSNIAVMDESHMAAGEGNTAGFFASILNTDSRSTEGLKGVLFMSATFAKNPTGMGMYARATNIGDANNTSGNLIGAVARGGAIMQEELSRGLTEGGQYIRRERPMEGDVRNEQGGYTNEESVQRIRENYDKVVAIVNNFAKFQSEYITPMLSLSPVEYAKQNGMVLPDGIKETELVGTVKIAEFQKQLNALKEQLLFAAKAEGVAEVAIEKLKAGERVVISFESTFESPLDDIAKVGEELESTDISRLIERYLSNLFKYDVQISTPKTRKRKYKKENETEEEKQKQFDFSARGTLSFDDLTDEAQKAYNILLSQLRNADTGLSLSPLDLIIDKITEAGFEVGEYTNRSSKVVAYKEKSGNGMVAKRVAKEKVNKEELQNSFNNGNVRCLLVNKAGSTGIDLHAGKNFKNQEQRCMIYAQFFKDVNDQVQMSYRVDRTNQAQRGAYFTFLSPIPAEQRLAMMYERKLKSLNANTTSDQSTGNEDVGADMLNKYGSKVVREYLLDAPDVLNSLGLEATIVNNLSDENYVAPQNDSLIRNVLQALAFAPTAVQEEFLRELTERYKMYVTGLNEAGENDLVSTVMKLDAKTVSRKLFTEGKNPGENNPFAENVLIDEVEANVLKKPLTSKEIVKHIERYKKMMTGEADVENISNEEAVEMFVKRIEGYYEAQKDNVKKQRKESEARRANIEKSVRKAAESAEKPLSEEEVNKLIATQVKAAHLDEETLETNESRGLSKIEYRKNLLIDTIRKEGNLFSIGKTVTIPTVLFENGVQQFDDKRFLSTGMFLGFKCGKRNLSESSIYAVYAVADGRRIIELPLSEVNNYGRLKTIIIQSSMPYLEEERNSTTIDNWDSITPSRGREIRHILTGNITQAMIDASSNPALKNGKLITYTDESGNVKHGYLLPVTFDAKAFRPKGSVSERIDDIMNDHQVEISYGGEAVGHIRKAQNRDVRNIEDTSLAERPVVITFQNKALITQEIRKTINTFIVSNDPQYKDYSYKGGEHKFILDGDMDSLSNLLAELSGIGLEADSKLAEWTFDEQGNPIDEKGNPAKQPKRKPVNVAKITRNANSESKQPLADEGILDLSKPMVLDDFRKFFYANNKDEELNRLFDIVYEAASKLGLGLSTFYMNQKGGLVIARFSPFSNSIEINTNPDGWLSMDKDEQSKTILHEMIHSVTSYVLHIVIIKRKCDSRNMRIPWGIRRVFDMLTPEQIDAAERLKNIYENATRNPVWETIADINDKYGLTNENEMVAELSNPVFRGALESIGLWKKVIKNITRLLRFVTPKTHSKEFVKKDAEIKEKAGFTKTNSLTETELNVERLIRSLDIPTYEAYLTAAKMQQAMEDDVRVLDAMLQPKNITIKPGETLSSFNERVKKAFKAGEILRKHHLDAANKMNLLKGTENANTIGLITNFLFDRFEQGGVPMWFETQESAQEAIEENEGAEFSRVTDKEASPFRLSDGTVYGWASADGIHLTMEGIRPDTMIHEYGHLWLAAMKENNPALYESLMRLAKDSPLWKEVTSDPAYSELADDDAILSEVFARFSGTEGERKMVDTMREAIANGEDMKEKASIAGLYSRLAKKLDKAWGWTLKYLDQDPTEFESMAEAADMLLKDIISGSSPNGGGYKPNGRLKTPKNGNPFFNSINEYSRGGNASQTSYIASDEYERRVATKTAMFEESWVDYLNSVRILQEALISETGNEIHDYENVYQHMMHLSSVNRAEQDKVWASHIEPMIEAMNNILAPLIAQYRENGAGRKTSRLKAMDELEKYLIASHGLERNKVLARRDAKAKADGEFYMRIKEAEKLLRKAQADFAAGRVTADVVQAAQDNLNQIETERQKREDDLYARNRQKDYSGFTETFGEQGQSYTNTELETIAKDFATLFEDKIDNKESIDNLWKTINAVNGYTLKKALDSGNISRDTYKRLTGQYSKYVPLRGWDDTTADEVYEYISEGDRSKPQNPNKTAKGRLSRAGDIIATIIAINSSAILTGNKNLAKQKLLNLVQNNKTSLTAVSNTWYVQLPDGTWEPSYPVDANGEPLTDPDAIADWEEDMKKLREEGSARMGHEHLSLGMPVVRWQEKEHQVRVNRNGREYVVYINGAPNASQAINGLLNMDASKSDSLEKMSRPVNRFMAKNFTSRNPLFVLRNFEKDVVSAAMLSGIKFGSGYVGKLIANVTRLLPGLAFTRKSTYKLGDTADVFERGTFGMYNLIRKYKEGRLDENDEVEKYFMEFMTHGGHTGYSNLYNVEESSKIVENRVRRANTRLSSEIVQNTLDAIGSWWDDINSSFEDITRFATFMASRQSGRSILESVADAKDASVNFNKKGSGKYGNRLARDIFIFINPAIQGIARYTYQLINKDVSGKGVDKGLKRHRTARALAGFATLVSVGVMNTLAGYFTSLMRGDDGDDDDKIFGKKGLGNDYWKLSTFKRRNTINIACGDGYIPINLTAEEALPYAIGAILSEHALGYGHNDQIMPELVGQLSRISPFGSIDPLKWNTASDMGKEMFKNLLPSSALPFWEIYDNKNFMGSQIHGYGNTLKKNSPVWQQNLQQKIDDATGRRLGAYGNINNIEHVAKGYLGGLAELPILIANCFEYAFTESPVNINETPMKVFWNSVQNEWNQKSALVGEFQYYKAKVDWVEEGLKAKELTKNAAQDVYVSKHLDENANYRYWKVFRKYEKQYNSRKQTDKTDLMKQIITEWRALDEAE